ncbi:MAG: hypothetical protein EP330_12640 [Deltaproteobacteria bacterium]|nr:MAG: hypothetical protein EP330_12640 [Deltaproteobacteria bacterium]
MTTATLDWTTAPLDELIHHILEQHHRPLDDELPRLAALAAKARAAHPEAGRDLRVVEDLLADITEDILDHMPKEEQVLFPMILRGQGHRAAMPVHVMGQEHTSLRSLLRRLQVATDDFHAPPEACRSWVMLWEGLEALVVDLVQHMHLEDQILFPRALGGE